jgi:hypothetical protein
MNTLNGSSNFSLIKNNLERIILSNNFYNNIDSNDRKVVDLFEKITSILMTTLMVAQIGIINLNLIKNR